MPSNSSLMDRLQQMLTAGLLAAAVAGGWVLSDEDPAWQLHLALKTNTLDVYVEAKEHIYDTLGILHGLFESCPFSAVSDIFIMRPSVMPISRTAFRPDSGSMTRPFFNTRS